MRLTSSRSSVLLKVCYESEHYSVCGPVGLRGSRGLEFGYVRIFVVFQESLIGKGKWEESEA